MFLKFKFTVKNNCPGNLMFILISHQALTKAVDNKVDYILSDQIHGKLKPQKQENYLFALLVHAID